MTITFKNSEANLAGCFVTYTLRAIAFGPNQALITPSELDAITGKYNRALQPGINKLCVTERNYRISLTLNGKRLGHVNTM